MNELVEWSGRAVETNDERRISASRESNVETSSLLLVSLSFECLVHETVIMSCQSFCCRCRRRCSCFAIATVVVVAGVVISAEKVLD